MEKKLARFINDTFKPYGEFPAKADVTRELLANLQDKYKDLKSQGKSDDEAYQQTIDSLGDVSEIMDEVHQVTPTSVHSFKGVALEESDLSDVDLTDANFSGSAIQKSNFNHSGLHKAKLSAAAISEATFIGTQLSDTTFSSSDLQKVQFDDATIVRTLFKTSGLKNASFKNAAIDEVTFKSSDLTNVSFEGSTITNTIFTTSSLTNAIFEGATLKNVSFHTEVKKTLFDGAIMDKVTYAMLKAMKASLDNVTVI